MSDAQMTKTLASEWRPQTSREEIANSVSSGVGLLAVMAGDPFARWFCDPTRGPMESGWQRHFRRGDGFSLSRIDDLSRGTAGQDQAVVSPA